MRKSVSATEEQWAVVEALAAEDAATRKESKPNVSRLLMELALAERFRRDVRSGT